MTSPPIDLLHLDRPLTWDDLQVIPDESHHHFELIEGQLLMSPSPNLRHQHCVVRLLGALVVAAPPDLDVLVSPFDFVPEPGTVLQPDLLVVRRGSTEWQKAVMAPVLAIEVISPSSRTTDRVTKRALYETFGVQHYWIVDPEIPEVLALQLEEGGYVEQESAAGSDELRVTTPFDLKVVPAELVAD